MSDKDQLLEVISKLRPKLQEYIESQGVHVNSAGFFSCIHPDHEDRHPSASLNFGNAPFEGEVFHCFSGKGHDGNIFTAAHWLEKLPINDFRFYTETLPKLCEQFGIAYTPVELSEDVKREYTKRRAYEDSLRVIQSMTYDGDQLKATRPGIKHLLDRGITEDTIAAFKIGTIDSYSAYLDSMKTLGWENANELQAFDLANKGIFDRDGTIIPIFDHLKQLVGYVTRNTKFDPNDHGSRKYYNSINSDIYQKGSILFNYNNISHLSGPLYIVEGYLDAVYLYQAGIRKVAAIGATSLTHKHIEMLYMQDQNDVIVCLDGDDTGREATRLALERLAEYRNIKVRVITLPTGQDPDSYVRERGAESFKNLEQLSPFKWTLTQSSYDTDLFSLAQNAIPVIASEESAVARQAMIRELSQFTSIEELDIKRDVEAIIVKESDKYLRDVGEVNTHVVMQLQRRSVRETRSIVQSAVDKLDIIEERHNSKIDVKDEYYQKLQLLEDKIVTGAFKFGFQTPRFKRLQKVLDGVPFWQNLILFGGRPSAGKTAFITHLSLDIVDANEDAAVFYMSIDDSADLMVQKILAVYSGFSTSKIKMFPTLPDDEQQRIRDAMDMVKKNAGRYVIADAAQGNTLEVLENHMSWFNKNPKFQDKKKLFILDNFHKLAFTPRANRIDALTEGSQKLKHLSQTYDTPIIATVELRKLSDERARPTRQDMSGTNKLDYDADVVALVHNDQQVNQATHLVHDISINGAMESHPWIEVDIVKNKINGTLALCPMKFNKYNMRFAEGKIGEFSALRQQQSAKDRNSKISFGRDV